MKYIGVAFSDLHMANWKQFNHDKQRLNQPLYVINKVRVKALKYDIPMLFAGDLIDHPRHIDNVVLEVLGNASSLLSVSKNKIIGINGNHDLIKINSFKNPQQGYLHHLSKLGAPFQEIDFSHKDEKYYRVHGIPYINGNSDFMEALEQRLQNLRKDHNILMVHRDLPGAVEPNGKRIDHTQNDIALRKALKKFDLVISGHIHKPQTIPKLGKHVYMLGAPSQQRRSDAFCSMGYWMIKKDFTLKFIPLNLPEFKYHEHDEEPTNNTDYWIRLPKKTTEQTEIEGSFKAGMGRKDLVEEYFKVKGIKNKGKLKLIMDLIDD